ncbi:MAG: RNA methyltransferase [Acidimicrobiia bacterium]|jgi:TrmH family RNA methyltransferase
MAAELTTATAILPRVGYDITSPANDRIKWLLRLRERKHRDAEGVFVIEGERLYGRALEAGLEPKVTFVSMDVATTGDTVTVAPEALDKASYRNRSQGIIGVFSQFGTGLERLTLSPSPLLLIAENIEKPGNLGAMMRTAAAAGADGLIAIGGTVDPFNPNAVRSSTGALFALPLAVASWEETNSWLEEHGIEVFGASPDGAVPVWEADMTGPSAIVIGAEDEGLSKQATAAAEKLVVIPQADAGVDSLNASVAAAVVLFEAVRQRMGS